jgi:hypothetical protein
LKKKLKLLHKIEAALEELAELPEPEQPTRMEKALLKVLPNFLKTVKSNIRAARAVTKR